MSFSEPDAVIGRIQRRFQHSARRLLGVSFGTVPVTRCTPISPCRVARRISRMTKETGNSALAVLNAHL